MGDFWYWAGDTLDYITLSTNSDDTTETRNEKGQKAIEILKSIDTQNNITIIQYTAIYDEKMLEKLAEDFVNDMNGKFVKCNYMIGKIIKDSYNRYIFKKKGAKKYGYELSKQAIYELILEN
jgi:hypothetical protein